MIRYNSFAEICLSGDFTLRDRVWKTASMIYRYKLDHHLLPDQQNNMNIVLVLGLLVLVLLVLGIALAGLPGLAYAVYMLWFAWDVFYPYRTSTVMGKYKYSGKYQRFLAQYWYVFAIIYLAVLICFAWSNIWAAVCFATAFSTVWLSTEYLDRIEKATIQIADEELDRANALIDSGADTPLLTYFPE